MASTRETNGMRISVYCASSAEAPQEYREAAYALGELLAKSQVTVVFGGGGFGSMGRLADGVLAQDGRLVGVMPEFMRPLEWKHSGVKEFFWTSTLAERKAILVENADAVVALPGGCGTFEELIEVLTLKRLGLYLNPIIIVNQNGFYDPLIELFERSVRDRFMDVRHLEMYSVVTTVEDVLAAIRRAPEWTEDARSFATSRSL